MIGVVMLFKSCCQESFPHSRRNMALNTQRPQCKRFRRINRKMWKSGILFVLSPSVHESKFVGIARVNLSARDNSSNGKSVSANFFAPLKNGEEIGEYQ